MSDVNYCYYFWAHFTRRYEKRIFKYQTKFRLFHFPKLKKSRQPFVFIIGIIWDRRKCQMCIFMWWSHKTGSHVEQRCCLRCCRLLLARLAPLHLPPPPDWMQHVWICQHTGIGCTCLWHLSIYLHEEKALEQVMSWQRWLAPFCDIQMHVINKLKRTGNLTPDCILFTSAPMKAVFKLHRFPVNHWRASIQNISVLIAFNIVF